MITARVVEFALIAIGWAAFVTVTVSLMVARIGRKK